MNNQQLREAYLLQLTQPDLQLLRLGKQRPKVYDITHWENITSVSVSGDAIDLAEAYRSGRRIWMFSDIHFFHANIIKYCNRPFKDPIEMTNHLIDRYKDIVADDDIVVWGGDIGFGSESKINQILNSLPGYKIQVVGNHDMHRDGKLYNLKFDERHVCLSIQIDETLTLLVTHYPMDSVPHGCINIHGHIHDLDAQQHNINICVEKTGYEPRSIQDIITEARSRVTSNENTI